MTYRISIKTTIAGATEQMRESISAIAEHLAEIEENTPAFLGFSVFADPQGATALFTLYVGEEDPDKATVAADSWMVTAITAAGECAWGWAIFPHPAEHERVTA
jgi:hypothetical protein